jgi:hypothetical protein
MSLKTTNKQRRPIGLDVTHVGYLVTVQVRLISESDISHFFAVRILYFTFMELFGIRTIGCDFTQSVYKPTEFVQLLLRR